MSEPKTCPFCGAAPDIRPWHGGVPTKTMVSCYNMDCAVQPEVTGKTEEEAVAAWNRRAPDPKCKAIVEMLESEKKRHVDRLLAERTSRGIRRVAMAGAVHVIGASIVRARKIMEAPDE